MRNALYIGLLFSGTATGLECRTLDDIHANHSPPNAEVTVTMSIEKITVCLKPEVWRDYEKAGKRDVDIILAKMGDWFTDWMRNP